MLVAVGMQWVVALGGESWWWGHDVMGGSLGGGDTGGGWWWGCNGWLVLAVGTSEVGWSWWRWQGRSRGGLVLMGMWWVVGLGGGDVMGGCLGGWPCWRSCRGWWGHEAC